MPSPIAHSVTGYAISRLPIVKRYIPKQHWPRSPLGALYSVLVVNLPDLDFLPQLVTGIRFHRGPSHSLAAALLVSLLLAWLVRHLPIRKLRPRVAFRAIFALTFAIYSSHLLMDLFTSGGSGLPLLWPISSYGFASPVPLFPAVHHSRGLLDMGHLVFVSIELVYAAALLYLVRLGNRRTSHRQPPAL